MGPRWRTSTPDAYLSMSFTDCTGYALISSAVIIWAIRDALGSVVLILEAVISISSVRINRESADSACKETLPAAVNIKAANNVFRFMSFIFLNRLLEIHV